VSDRCRILREFNGVCFGLLVGFVFFFFFSPVLTARFYLAFLSLSPLYQEMAFDLRKRDGK
jgi:hypothetical protein